ncbi:MAG: alpha/beta fold hydrolase [Leptospiraceae bacterium]|nr:alpha/beta fold hydrolase [Leptospiraceae bacterium]
MDLYGKTRVYDDLSEPDHKLKFRELSVIADFFGGIFSRNYFKASAKTNPKDILILPGFGTNTRYMFLLKYELESLGHNVEDWGVGFNHGDVPVLAEQFAEVIQKRFQESQKKITLVGWSLGGYIARETARDFPEIVEKVITMGTPVIGGPRYTAAAKFYERKGESLDEIEKATIERFEKPLEVPIVAFYAKTDGVVSWQACIDHWSKDVEHIEVQSSHLGMGFSREILDILPYKL